MNSFLPNEEKQNTNTFKNSEFDEFRELRISDNAFFFDIYDFLIVLPGYVPKIYRGEKQKCN